MQEYKITIKNNFGQVLTFPYEGNSFLDAFKHAQTKMDDEAVQLVGVEKEYKANKSHFTNS